MPIKSDRWIREMSREKRMIEPFSDEQVRSGISFGLSSYGYDLSLHDEFQIPSEASGSSGVIDPKGDSKTLFQTIHAPTVDIPPQTAILARTKEYFRIPRGVLTICFGKSTYARCGLLVNVTPFEPEWEGFATLSLVNASSRPIRVYANEGIAQLLFLESDELCERSYADKKGRYQAQQSITHAKGQAE